MTSRSYFGKINSLLGSVVPLAMFLFREEPLLEGEEDDVIGSKVQEDSESRDGR